MKKIIYVCLMVLVCTSCKTKYFFQSYNSKLTQVKESTKTIPLNNTNTYEDERMRINFSLSPTQICFTINNKSDEPLIINWDKISYINQAGSSHRIMHAGVKYIERNSPQLNSIIAPRATLSDILTPVNNVYYIYGEFGGWNTKNLFPYYTKDISIRNLWRNVYLGSSYSVYFPISWEDGITKNLSFDFIIDKIYIVQHNPDKTYYVTLDKPKFENENK